MPDPNLDYWIREIEIRDGKAYLPFSIDELEWLADLIPASDKYADVVAAVIAIMSSDGLRP